MTAVQTSAEVVFGSQELTSDRNYTEEETDQRPQEATAGGHRGGERVCFGETMFGTIGTSGRTKSSKNCKRAENQTQLWETTCSQSALWERRGARRLTQQRQMARSASLPQRSPVASLRSRRESVLVRTERSLNGNQFI